MTATNLRSERGRRARRPAPAAPHERLIDRFAPDPQVAERHEILVRAPAELVLETAETFDLLSIPAVWAIFRLRARLMRAPPPEREDLAGLVAATKRIGWVELARRPGREVVMGAAVQPWLAEPLFEPVAPERFVSFDEPDRVKIVWTLEADPLAADRARLRTETRVVPSDADARRKFRRYWRKAGIGIVLIRLLVLPAIRREAEQTSREAEVRSSSPLLDRLLPRYDVTLVREKAVDAPVDVTYAAIADTNLLDPVVRALFAVRELPIRLLARLRGQAPPAKLRSISVADFLRPGSGMVLLAERPGSEMVVGSVGRFWERAYGHRNVPPEAFTSFDEPGYAKLAMDLWARPSGAGRSLLRYEARTATTDAEGRRRFRRYWRLIRPGVWLVMGRAVTLIRKEAERRARGAGRAAR